MDSRLGRDFSLPFLFLFCEKNFKKFIKKCKKTIDKLKRGVYNIGVKKTGATAQKEKMMKEYLIKQGIDCDNVNTYEWNGKLIVASWSGNTPSGKRFLMFEAGSGWKIKYTVKIDGKTVGTNFLLNTAIAKIKAN